jgi:HK97 family phage major capsid protein
MATVVVTDNDLHFPTKAAFGTAALKAESGGAVNVFGEGDPALGTIFLSAFVAGTANTVSLELSQDVPSFTAFLNQDVSLDLQTLEENLFVNGSGVGQAQGMLGNVGAGVTEEPDAAGNLVSLSGLLDCVGSLKSAYCANAHWLMSRSTSILIRKAQMESNYFAPVWTRENGEDMLHGYPVAYSSAMPTAARATTPILFGDFAYGYLIGDRGGPGVRVALLDQSMAASGQYQVLIYRRTDGRVRRSEAIQSYNIAAS